MKQVTNNVIVLALVLVLGLPVSFTESAQQPRRTPGQEAEPPVTNLEELQRGNTPQNLGPSGEPISIDYLDVPLADFVASMATQLDINVEMPANLVVTPQSNITIISTHAVPEDIAFELLESVLRSRGYQLVETLDGNLYKLEGGNR